MSKPNDSFTNEPTKRGFQASNLNPGECVLDDGTIVPCGPGGLPDEIKMTEVSFAGNNPSEGWDVKKDSGSGAYTAPHWKKGSPNQEYPYLYKQGCKLKIANAKFTRLAPVAGDTYKVKGTGPDGISIPETAATPVAGTTDTFEINDVVASSAFAADKVKFYDTFDIEWKVSINDGAWVDAGKSENPIYVSLDGSPNGKHYYTVVHLACSNDGATNADEAVTKSWALLSGPGNFQGWNETAKSFSRKLHYYRKGIDPRKAGAGAVEKLLQNVHDSGQCSTWANLFIDAIKLNKASSTYVVCTPTADQCLLVKDWTFDAIAGAVWNFKSPNGTMVMHPEPANRKYGQLTNKDTIEGQNAAAPAQKIFINHQFVKYSDSTGKSTYYDPSYGVTFVGVDKDAAEKDFQSKALDGFGRNDRVAGTKWNIDIRKTTAVKKVRFSA